MHPHCFPRCLFEGYTRQGKKGLPDGPHRLCYLACRAVATSQKDVETHLNGEHNLPPLVDIGLADLPKRCPRRPFSVLQPWHVAQKAIIRIQFLGHLCNLLIRQT